MHHSTNLVHSIAPMHAEAASVQQPAERHTSDLDPSEQRWSVGEAGEPPPVRGCE